jgi:hypothetical protein
MAERIRSMRRKALLALSLVAAVSAVLFISTRWPFISRASNDVPLRQPVVVELFTSEGCSSCPPADLLLKQLSDEQPFEGIQVIALEEHVDYWNHLGWRDPYSSNDFSVRQDDYSNALPRGGVYTPQMIVDGRVQFVGSRRTDAREQIRAAAAHPIAHLLLSAIPASDALKRSFELRFDPASAPLSGSSFDLYVAVTEKGLRSSPTAGENSGESLQHAPVVRELRKLQAVHLPFPAPVNFTVNLRDHWALPNLTVVAFLADHHRQIQAAGTSPVL